MCKTAIAFGFGTLIVKLPRTRNSGVRRNHQLTARLDDVYRIMKCTTLTALIVANLGWATASAAPGARPDDGMFSLTTGFDYAAGKYSTANTTDVLSMPAASREYESGQWMFQVAVPHARASSTGSLVPGIGHITASGANRDTPSDLGDTVAAASYNIYSGKSSTFGIDLTGKVKLKATDSAPGACQNDYAAQAAAYQTFNKFTALGSLGYGVLGSSATISMNKVIYGSFGGTYQLDDKMHGGVDLNLSQSASLTGDGHREVTAYVSRKIGKNFNAKGYFLKGLSNGSPDNSLGAQIRYGF